MIKQDRSMLFDSKMELHPEEESFADPTITTTEKRAPKFRWDVLLKVGVAVVLVIVAFIGGYLVRRAVFKSKCSGSGDSGARQRQDDSILDKILADMSSDNIEQNLRFACFLVRSLTFALMRWPNTRRTVTFPLLKQINILSAFRGSD